MTASGPLVAILYLLPALVWAIIAAPAEGAGLVFRVTLPLAEAP